MSRLVPLVLLLSPSLLLAENWPGWRGPRGDGSSLEKNVPLEWSATENVRWKVKVPGVGHSSPIIYGDRVFVTTCDSDNNRVLMCLNREDGSEKWQKVVFNTKLEKKHPLNSYASGTPATDGKHVYVAFL